MLRRKTIVRGAALIGATALLASLAACSSGGESEGTADDPVTISFWDNNGGPARTPVYDELIKQFEEANPNIKVDYVGVPASDAPDKLQTAVAGGSVPDVAIVTDWLVSSLAAQNALVALDDRLDSSDLKGKISDDVLQAAKDASFDKKLYILPDTSTAAVMWYRTDWFKDAGLTPPNTWADFYKAASTLTDPATGKYGFALRGASGSVNQLASVAISCSGIDSFFDDDGKSRLDDPKVGECIQQYADMYGVDTSTADLSNGYQEMITEFDNGDAGMALHNLGSAQNHIDAFGEGVAAAAPVPAVDATGKYTLVAPSTEGPAIFAGSEHQDAAWKFTEFLLSHDANSYWNQKAGQIPANIDARADQWVTDNQPISNAIASLSDPDTTIVTPPIYLPDWSGILGDLVPDFQSVLLKEKTGQEFAAEWADKLTTAETEYREQFGK